MSTATATHDRCKIASADSFVAGYCANSDLFNSLLAVASLPFVREFFRSN
jgi:hypothetical protein